MGEISWCQLFSEPGAGSDLAGLSTRAERVDGGWESDRAEGVDLHGPGGPEWGICLARTDPDVPKHDGITYFIVDMTLPGLDVRPLRELTGAAMFNEVFFDAVFVPDDCVIGEVDRGWGIARMTLANERVSISSGATFGTGVESLVRLAAAPGRRRAGVHVPPSGRPAGRGPVAPADDPPVGALRSLAGADPGPAARACASCWAPSTSSGSRSSGSRHDRARGGDRGRGPGRPGGPQGVLPPAASPSPGGPARSSAT